MNKNASVGVTLVVGSSVDLCSAVWFELR